MTENSNTTENPAKEKADERLQAAPCSASSERVPPPPIVWLQLWAEDELGATWTERQITPEDTAYTRVSDDLLCEVDQMQAEIAKLRADCRKYRLALNRVASPKNWGVHDGYHVEIARRALLIGEKCEPLPDGARILPNATTHTPGANEKPLK